MSNEFRTLSENPWSLEYLMKELQDITPEQLAEHGSDPTRTMDRMEGEVLVEKISDFAQRLSYLSSRYFNISSDLGHGMRDKQEALNKVLLSSEEQEAEKKKLHDMWHRAEEFKKKGMVLWQLFWIVNLDTLGWHCEDHSLIEFFGGLNCRTYYAIRSNREIVERTPEYREKRIFLHQEEHPTFPMDRIEDLCKSMGLFDPDDF